MMHVIALAAVLAVNGAYAHPAVDSAAVYFTIANAGAADTLDGVRCSDAASATLHRSERVGRSGRMLMLPVAGIRVPARGSVTFEPGGYHVMLENLKRPLAVGQHFMIRLHFARAGWVNVRVAVRPY